jgi:hypothetical protein
MPELEDFERAALACKRRAAEQESVQSAMTPEQQVFWFGETRAEMAVREGRAAVGYRAAFRALEREAGL